MNRRSTHLATQAIYLGLVIVFTLSFLPPHAMAEQSWLPPGQPAVVGPTMPAAAPVSAPPALLGALRFAPVVDSDDNPASNPASGVRVPVHRVGAPLADAERAGDAALYAVVALAVEVTPDEATRNPAGVMVEFTLWDDAGLVTLTQQARADAWGAASAEFFLDDLHLAGTFHYSARAGGYGETPPRTFSFDQTSYASDVWLGAARLTATVDPDGRLVADVESDVPIDDSLLAVQLTALRLEPTDSGAPDKTLLPPLAARRLDDHHARAEIYLEAGDYLISTSAASGVVEARSQPALVHIAHVDAPPIAALEQFFDFSDDGESVLVQYRTPGGDVALLPRAVADLPAQAPPAATPPIFQQQTRVAPFQWRTQVYSTTVETALDDGKKRATLDGFSYDPIARTYDIKIESLMDQPVEDKLTVQVFGPNRVVIYEETVPIWLDPAQPFHYQFSLPSDRGEPYGLRIHVHDPLDFDWALQLISDSVTTVYNALGAAVAGSGVSLPLGLSFSLTAGFGFSIKVVEIDVLTASISCTAGQCKAKDPTGIFFGSAPWLGVVTDGVKTFLRNQYRDILATDDMDAILKKLGEGISLGALTLSATASARLTYDLVDPGSCVNQQALDQAKQYVADLGFAAKELGDTITFRAKDLSEKLQNKGKINLSIPGAWFLGAQLSPVLAFKLKADKSGDYAVYAELQVELGGKATLKLKASAIFDTIFALLEAKDFVIGIYRILDTARTAQKVFAMLSSASAYAAGGGCSSGGGGGGKRGPNPPPPNGAPDDRIDAPQSQFLPDPRGPSGDIQTLQQLVATAQAAGLTRAATYFSVQLRRQELAAFELDTARTISHTAELDAAYDQAYLRVTGLISGTVLPDPGQTVTDAVRSTYTDYLIDIAETNYSQERRALLDSLDFALLQYSLLRGQELELQYELRQMLTAGGVGLVDSGLVESALGAIGSLGVRARPIEIVAGTGSSGLPDSRYVAPFQAPPVVIVPSGGLYRYRDSAEARAWLETYVATGGTLIVLAQFDSGDWEMLPGGQVRGLGYDQDILCKQASVHIVNSSPWIVGIGRDLPDIQIDGSFTQWPADATIILMRTTGNQMPAMIEYPYGLGQVVATSAYPDFYMNGMQSTEDIIFARSLFGQAYLQGTGQTPVVSLAPYQTAAIPVEVTNTNALSATQITLYQDYYAARLGDSWRWAVHQPDPFGGPEVVTLTPPLPSGASRTVSFNLTAPATAGIFRLGYFMGADTAAGFLWNRSGTMPGVYYQVLSAPVKTDLFRFQLTPDQPAYDFGQAATLTATLFNDRAVARTFTLEPRSGLAAAPVEVVVAPHSTASQTYTTIVDRTRQVRLAALENGNTVSELVTTVRLKLPTLGLSGAPDEMLAGVAANGTFTATVSNAPVGTTTLDWEVRQNGALLQSTSTPLVGTVGNSLAELAASLPAAPPDTEFTVRVALPNTSRVMTLTIPVLRPVAVRSTFLTDGPVIGDQNTDLLLVSLEDPGYPGQYAVQALLKNGSTVLSSSPVVTGASGSTLTYETLDLPLPASLTLGITPTIAISLTGQFAGAADSYTDTFELPLALAAPQVSLSDATRKAGQPLDIIVEALPDNVELPADSPFDISLIGLSTYGYYYLPIESFTPTARGVVLHTHVPPYLYSGGLYDVQVTSWQLDGWQSHSNLSVPPHQIELEAPPAIDAGDTLTATIRNTGGVTATLYGSAVLADRQKLAVAEASFYLDVPAGGSRQVAVPVPDQLRNDNYRLNLLADDQLSRPVSLSRLVTVHGLTAELDSRTDQPAYLASDLVSTTSVITPSGAISGASLRLRVLGTPPPAGDWDGWRAELADGGMSNYVSQEAAGPFVPTWSVSPNASVAPVAYSDLVVLPGGSCSHPQAQAVDSLDGEVRWQSPDLPNYPEALAANNQYVFVRTSSYCSVPDAAPETGDNSLVALDGQTGALIWQMSLNSYDALLASDAAVLVQDYDSNGYLLLDPNTGITRTVLTDVTGALLVDDRVFVREQGSDNLVAYDAATGGQLWSVAAPSDSELLAANTSYVLTFQEYDYSTYDLTNLLSVYDLDGNLLGDVTLTTRPSSPGMVLTDDTLYYLYVDVGGSTIVPEDIVSTIYAVDLAGFSESTFFTSEDEISAMVGTGSRLHVVESYSQTLISLDETGATLGQSDISGAGAYSINALTVDQQGLLVLEDGGYHVYALQASAPVYGGGGESVKAVTASSVFREDWLAVDGNGVITLPYPLTNPDLGDNPLARGLLYLEAVLFGSEPASVPQPGNRQRLASSVYPFTLDNAATSIELATDRPAYRRNVPGYAADDALSAVTLSGRVRNTGLTPDDITLQIQRNDGATLLSQTFTAVGPNETRPFSALDPVPPQGSVIYTGTTSLGDTSVAAIQVLPSALSAVTAVTPTILALGEGATLEVSLANPGAQLAVVTADLGDGPQDVTLAGGEAITLTRALTPSAGGELSLPVVFTGDINRTDTPTTTVRDETASASIVLSGTIRSLAGTQGLRPSAADALVQGDNAALDIVVQNDQSFSFDALVDYALAGPEGRTGSQAVTLDPGLTTVHILLGSLAAGDYTATVTVRHARLGTVIASAGLSFSVVNPIYDLHVAASAGEMNASGDITITVTASSTTSSEQPWTGALVVEDGEDSTLRQPLSLLPGSSATYSQTLSLRDRAGPQTLHVALFGPDGTAASELDLVIDGPQRLAPAATLTGLTASAGAAGGPVTLTATVDNDGPAGDAPLSFLAFDTTYEVVGALPAYGSHAVALTVTAPAGLLAGTYPAEVHLADQSAKTGVVLSGAQIDLTHSLDAASYQPGSQAIWTIHLHGVSGGPATYDVVRRYVTQAITDTVTLGAGQTVHVPWTFDVGPASNRAQVMVRPHIAGNAEETPFALVIDSRWVPVIEDPYAWLESDKASYQAGETVHLTMHLLQPTDAAYVLAPGEIAAPGSPLLWSNLTLTETYTITNPYTVGDFAIDYPLPATLRSGRYHFLYAYDSEERSLPIDVHGVDLFTEDLVVAGPTPGAPLLPGDPLTLTARLRLNVPLGSATLLAYAQLPDNTPVDLGPLASQTVALPAGETVVTLHGALPASVLHSPAGALPPGTYRITFQVQDPATLAVLGGDAAYVDVGSAVISDLATDHGVYAQNAAGTGTLTAYGIDTAHVHVETSGGTVLLDQNAALNGFQAFDFVLPTGVIGDEVLIGTMTDSHGLVSSLQAAYKVANDFDTAPPAVKILSPANGERVTLPADHQLTVSGVFTEETTIDTVLVNGQAAQLSGNTWSTVITATLGSNLIQVVALDAAGNASQPDLADVTGEPGYGIDFTVVPTMTMVNNVVGYLAVITATEPLTAEVVFPFSVKAVNPAAGSATTGTLSLDLPVSWTGMVTPGEPVTIQWTGQATEPISRTISTLVQGPQMLPRFSQDVKTNITTAPLAVTLDSFEAQLQGDSVLLTWETVSELNNAGFNLYRSTDEAGEHALLAFVPSAAPGSGLGSSYQWVDESLPAAPVIYYWLEAVDFGGATSLYGPVSTTTLPPTAVRLTRLAAGSQLPASHWSLSLAAIGLALLIAGWPANRRRRRHRTDHLMSKE